MGTKIHMFPQANSIERIIEIIGLVQNNSLSETQICIRTGIVSRQARYYLFAMRYLGILNDLFQLTSFGRQLMKLKSESRSIRQELRNKILSIEIFNIAYNYVIDNGKPIKREEIAQMIIRETTLSYTTAYRRATTVSKWVEWCLLNKVSF